MRYTDEQLIAELNKLAETGFMVKDIHHDNADPRRVRRFANKLGYVTGFYPGTQAMVYFKTIKARAIYMNKAAKELSPKTPLAFCHSADGRVDTSNARVTVHASPAYQRYDPHNQATGYVCTV